LDVVITGGRVMDPESGLDVARNVGIRDGKIAQITEQPLKGKETIDAHGLVVAPGIIDLHQPGQNVENDVAKAADGVTTSLEMEVGTADIDAAKICHLSTYQKPNEPSEGISFVLVNGVEVPKNGKLVEAAAAGRGVRAPIAD